MEPPPPEGACLSEEASPRTRRPPCSLVLGRDRLGRGCGWCTCTSGESSRRESSRTVPARPTTGDVTPRRPESTASSGLGGEGGAPGQGPTAPPGGWTRGPLSAGGHVHVLGPAAAAVPQAGGSVGSVARSGGGRQPSVLPELPIAHGVPALASIGCRPTSGRLARSACAIRVIGRHLPRHTAAPTRSPPEKAEHLLLPAWCSQSSQVALL